MVSVTFSDNNKCNIISTSDTEVKCITDEFDPLTIDTVNPYGVTIMVNSVEDVSNSVTLSSSVQNVVSIEPASVSPVLKQDLIITFEPSFPNIDKDDYKVIIRGSDKYERELYIVDMDNVTKQMKVKFNGAPSDSYVVSVKGPTGYVGGPRLILETIIAIDTIAPMKGSVLGGTLVTITGNHYGNTATDNPVKIGDNYCLVEETSEFEIKCRIAIRKTTVVS